MTRYEVFAVALASVVPWLAVLWVLREYRKQQQRHTKYVAMVDRQREEALKLARERAITINAVRVSLTDCAAQSDLHLSGPARELVVQCLSVLGWKQRRATSIAHGNIALS